MVTDSPELRIIMTDLIQDKATHWAAIAAAADILSTDARFNLWLAQGGEDQDGNHVLKLLDRLRGSYPSKPVSDSEIPPARRSG